MKSCLKKTVSWMLVIFAVSFFEGCSENLENEEAKLDYLSIYSEKSLTEFTPEEWDILDEAKGRLNITITPTKLMNIEQKSGSEVNISEHLYRNIKLLIDNGNKIIQEATHTTTRMSGDDCVARCIVNVAGCFGGNLSLVEVAREIKNRCPYGPGVPSDRVNEMVNIWLIGTPISTPLTTASLGGGPCQIIAVVLGTHAVVFRTLNGDTVRVYDEMLVREDSMSDPNNGIAEIPNAYLSDAIKVTGLSSGGY